MKKTAVTNPDLDVEMELAHAAQSKARADRDAARAEAQRLQIAFSAAKDRNYDEAAAAYLAGTPVEGAASLAMRSRDANESLAMLERAVAIATDRVREVQKRIDKRTRDAARPRHMQAVRRIAAALCELSAAIEEEERLRLSLPGGALSLPPMGFAGIGWVSLANSPAKMWLARAKSLGFLPQDYSPKLAQAAE